MSDLDGRTSPSKPARRNVTRSGGESHPVTDDPARDEFGREISPNVLRRLALQWATRWCDRREAIAPDRHDVIRGPHDLLDEQALADVLREATTLAELAAAAATLELPTGYQVRCGSGPGGLVVMVQGPRWNLIARAGGPVAIVCPQLPDGVSVDYQPSSPTDPIALLVSALITLARRVEPSVRGAVGKNF